MDEGTRVRCHHPLSYAPAMSISHVCCVKWDTIEDLESDNEEKSEVPVENPEEEPLEGNETTLNNQEEEPQESIPEGTWKIINRGLGSEQFFGKPPPITVLF